MSWTDTTPSNTTLRNASRFVLLGFTEGADGVVTLPQIRGQDASGRGPGFVITAVDPLEIRDA